jgi:hypothetical protein
MPKLNAALFEPLTRIENACRHGSSSGFCTEKSFQFGYCLGLRNTLAHKEPVEGCNRDADALGDSMVSLVGKSKISRNSRSVVPGSGSACFIVRDNQREDQPP